MKKAGEIIALIAGIFAVIAAFVTLMAGGLASALNAEGGQAVVGLGWGGVGFSFLVIILSAIGLGTSNKITSVLLILASIGGAILGGTLVAIFMALSFIGGILALIGTKSKASETVIVANQPRSKKQIAIVSVVAFLFLAMCIIAYVRNGTKTTTTEVTEITEANAESAKEKAVEVSDCKSYVSNLKQTNIFITAVEKAQTFDPSVYDNLIGATGQSLLVPAYPGSLMHICIADVYYSDSSKGELVYTVSKLEDQSIHIVTKDNAAIIPVLNIQLGLKKELARQDKEAMDKAAEADNGNEQNANDSTVIGKSHPSFDCAKAHGYVEVAICEHDDLAQSDYELNNDYNKMKASVDEIQLKAEQTEWLKQRNQCGDIQCIKNAYQLRAAQFASESE